jgi:hypothetical protein
MTWPQLKQRDHSPLNIGFISLKLWASTQYGHRIALGIEVGEGQRRTFVPQGGALLR